MNVAELAKAIPDDRWMSEGELRALLARKLKWPYALKLGWAWW